MQWPVILRWLNSQPLQCVTFNYLIVPSYLLTCVAFYYLIVVSYLLICGMNKMNSVISMTIATCTVSQSLILAYIVVVCRTPPRPLSSTHKNMWNYARQRIRPLTHSNVLAISIIIFHRFMPRSTLRPPQILPTIQDYSDFLLWTLTGSFRIFNGCIMLEIGFSGHEFWRVTVRSPTKPLF